jgi:hypothetical protein
LIVAWHYAGNDVKDLDTWNLAVAAVKAEFVALPLAQQTLLAEMSETVKDCKRELHAVVETVSAAGVCAACGGECCRTGKYHFTVVELLVHLVERKELFTPRFEQQFCPFFGERGCLMTPAYRPFNCVIFNCERLENQLAPAQKERLVLLERMLRAVYAGFERLFGNRFMGGLLMNCERDIIRGHTPILGTNASNAEL